MGETQRDADTSVDGSSQSQHHQEDGSPMGNVPVIRKRPASAGLDALMAELEAQERTNYFDESRRFGSPEKTQQTPVKKLGPLAGWNSAMKGTIPMGLTQLFNNTQDSPLQPTRSTIAMPPPDSAVNTSPPRSPSPEKAAIDPPSVPQKGLDSPVEIYYSMTESQEARERRLGKGVRRGPLRADSSNEDALTAMYDGHSMNRKTRRAVPAKRKIGTEVKEARKDVKAPRVTKADSAQKTSTRAKASLDQALRSITKTCPQESNTKTENRKDAPKRVSKTASQKRREDKAQVMAEKRMRNRNFPPPTADESTTDDEDSPPLPHCPISEATKSSERSSGVQTTKPPEPFGPSDWEKMHEPRPILKRHDSFRRRKRTSIGLLDPPPGSNAIEYPTVPPPPLKVTKSSIKNMPPFNVPRIPPLLHERSTFSPVPFDKIYQGSSPIPRPPALCGYDESPPISSPPPLPMEAATTTHIEKSPPPGNAVGEGGVEVVASQLQALTPQLHRRALLDRAGTVPETSPIVEGNIITPVRRPPFSRAQTSSTAVTETDTDTDRTPRAVSTNVVSPSKRKRDAVHSKATRRDKDIVSPSRPRDHQASLPDGDGDTNMGESQVVPATESDEPEYRGSERNTGSRKKRKREGQQPHLKTLDYKENRKQLEAPQPAPGTEKVKGLKSKLSTSTIKENTGSKLPSTKKSRASLGAPSTTNSVFGEDLAPTTLFPITQLQESDESHALHRVFALFRDKHMYYHPATVLPNCNVARSHLRVVFDDGTEVVTDRCHLRRLTLQVGDIIKCSVATMKPKLWVVIGFPEAQMEPDATVPEWAARLIDTEGHRTVLLKEKKKGAKFGMSTQNNTTKLRDDVAEGTTGETVEVAITNIYLVKTLWTQFKHRVYDIEAGSPEAQTPLSRFSAVPPDTPFSKTRNPSPFFPSTANASKLQPSTIASSVNPKKITDGVFSGMVFALSFGDNETEKKGITTKILAHGGQILENGFDEVFEPIGTLKSKSVSTSTTTDTSDTERDAESVDGNFAAGGDIGLQPLAGTDSVGFSCVIADTYSRRAKFLQALALGIPCLAGRWVDDCVKRNTIVDWEIYLLPAGESAYLSGAIRSRILSPFPAATSTFMGIMGRRRKLLDGCSVLLVMGKGKMRERRKPYRFLIYAMGAKVVKGVGSVEEANGILREGMSLVTDSGVGGVTGAGMKWDLVYLDAGSTRGGRDKLWAGIPKGWLRPRVVDDEWVVQSLILGKLLDDA